MTKEMKLKDENIKAKGFSLSVRTVSIQCNGTILVLTVHPATVTPKDLT